MPFSRPRTLEDALRLRATGDWRVLAGGTDLYPATQSAQLNGDILDITAITALRGISHDPQAGLKIGAATSWSTLREAPLPEAIACLQQAGAEVGARQIQNSGTIGGNLCNASPAADGVPPLLVLDAEVTLASTIGTRRMPLCDFITGNRQTKLRQDELLTDISIPATSLRGHSAFIKLGARNSLVISIAMIALRVVMEGGKIGQCAIAVGACSAVAQRLPKLEQSLLGCDLAQACDVIAAAPVASSLSPIDDIRGSASYRAAVVPSLIADALRAAVAGQEVAA